MPVISLTLATATRKAAGKKPDTSAHVDKFLIQVRVFSIVSSLG
jgi:hypothetical protein